MSLFKIVKIVDGQVQLVNEDGETILVDRGGLSLLRVQDDTQVDLLKSILTELKRLNAHLSVVTDEEL